MTDLLFTFTGLMTSLLKGLKDSVLPKSAQTNTVTHHLIDNMGMFKAKIKQMAVNGGFFYDTLELSAKKMFLILQMAPVLTTTASSMGRSQRKRRTTRTGSSKP